MRTDRFNYDDERYSEQDMQAVKVNRNTHIYPKSLQNFDNNRAKALTNKNQTESPLLDKDVSDWLSHQDIETKRYINDMIRLAMTRLPQLSKTMA
ncbi:MULTISPECIES: hypothetical protein [Moraxellaceae]|jgi:hypothetical protein|uniref:Uncharacterized protein n=1 Tax=Moraxella nonliquefaciens TaxID=478 RepID=A0A1B8PJ65_MORNO|nr:hypothetical protein [Moraxella nonliquefaciens]OBX48352.1 hypothetical protein A9Z65_03730 [Moraxella nonliquefaciens]OBX49638.1 hypothetical protein A9Z60_03135 [Moraxella nonliquefaciens]